MAVFPLENGVFSGTLLRFNVRGYVYIWSLIFSMFKFFVDVFMCAHYDLCVLIVYATHCICYSLWVGVFAGVFVGIHYTFIWGNGEMGFKGETGV